MSVRAKFWCVDKLLTKEGAKITLYPIIDGSQENKEFFKYTPSGSISINTINHAAAEQFVPGDEYYVDFTPAK